MKRTFIAYTGFWLASVALIAMLIGIPALAHDGEDHAVAQDSATEVARLEKVITLMQQVIVLMTALRTAQSHVYVAPTTVTVHDHHADEVDTTDHSDHTTEHIVDVVEEKRLIIEVEPHNNQTHVHVRYVDKAEEMFFIDAALSNEDGIVTAVSTRTGLTLEEVRAALKFMQ